MVDHRARLMLAALGFLRLGGPQLAVRQALHGWLDSWSGVGQIAVGMARQGFDLQLTRYDEQGWRATFYSSGIEHCDQRDRIRLRAGAVDRRATSGMGGRG